MKYYLLLFATLLSFSLVAQNNLPDEVRTNIEKRIEFGHSPSIVVGIIDAKGPKYYTFGTTTMDGETVDEHTIYEIGSISKTFTGILLAQLVKEGKVKLDDPVQKYLPEEVKMPTWEGQAITLGHLSDHTSSLPRLPANMSPSDQSNPYADYTVEQMYDFLSDYELPREIGSVYEYSNLAQGLLGHVLALIAGESYEDLVKNRIAKPLGMKATTVTLNDKQKAKLAPGHNGGQVVSNWDLPTLAGAGAIRSSLHDMLIYMAANTGKKKNGLYAAMQLSHQARHDMAGTNRVGLAWHIGNGAEGDFVWHNGGTGGYRTFSGFSPKTGRGVVVLTNSTQGADDIGFHLLDSNAPLREVKPSATNLIKKAISDQGAKAGWVTYEKIKKDKTAFDVSEDELNSLGYLYLQQKQTDAALTVFKINVDAFPNSFNVYDSYGEALMQDGQKEAAIENYQKSLELNPANLNGKGMLAKLGVETELVNVAVSEEVLDTYLGKYEIQPSFHLVITREGTQLYAQATGQARFDLYAKSETEFYLTVVDAQVVFKLEDGKATSLTLFQGGQEIPAKKVE